MARVVLVNLASLPMPGNEPIFPIGARCVEDALEREGHFVKLVDFVEQPEALTDLRWVSDDWDVVAIAIRNIDPIDLACDGHVDDYLRFVDRLRAMLPKSRPLLVGGGPGFSLFAETLIKKLRLDVGVVGPAETQMIEIARDPKRFIESGTLLNGSRYTGFTTYVLSHPPGLIRAYADLPNAMIGVETRRKTCFQSCVYCPYAYISGENAGDDKQIETLGAEILGIRAAGFRRIFFTDAIFNTQMGHAKRVVQLLGGPGFEGLSWSGYFTPRTFSDEFAGMLHGSGLESVVISPDSLDDGVMRLLGKGFDVATVSRFVDRCRKHGLHIKVNLVFGGPGETRESVARTSQFANDMLDDDELSMHVGYRILPHTALADETGLRESDLLYPTFYPFNDNLVHWILQDLDARFITTTALMSLLAGRASARRMGKLQGPGLAVHQVPPATHVAISRTRPGDASAAG